MTPSPSPLSPTSSAWGPNQDPFCPAMHSYSPEVEEEACAVYFQLEVVSRFPSKIFSTDLWNQFVLPHICSLKNESRNPICHMTAMASEAPRIQASNSGPLALSPGHTGSGSCLRVWSSGVNVFGPNDSPRHSLNLHPSASRGPETPSPNP